jgi:hypothetical protein
MFVLVMNRFLSHLSDGKRAAPLFAQSYMPEGLLASSSTFERQLPYLFLLVCFSVVFCRLFTHTCCGRQAESASMGLQSECQRSLSTFRVFAPTVAICPLPARVGAKFSECYQQSQNFLAGLTSGSGYPVKGDCRINLCV